MNSGLSVVYIDGSQVIISPKNKIVILILKIHFILANSVVPDEMQPAFHLGFHCLPNTHLRISSLPKSS